MVLPTTIGLSVHFLFHVNITILVLSALMVRSFVWHQFMIAIVLMVLRVRSQMTSRSLPSAKETMSSAKACRYPGVSLGVSERRSSTTKFHRKGDRMPPWGHPLRILMVLEVFLWLMVIYLLVTILMIQWAVAASRLVFLIAVATALKETLSNAASISRNTPRTYPFLAILRSIKLVTLCRAASVEHPFLKPY